MKQIVWRSLLALGTGVAGWSFAYFQGGYLAYHLWDAMKILALLIIIQLLVPLRRLAVKRTVDPSETTGGNTVTVELHIAEHSWWPWAWVSISDPLPLNLKADRDPHFVLALWPRRRTTVRYQLCDVQRGVYSLGHPVLTTGDIFGLWTKSLKADTPATVLMVWPKTVVLHNFGTLFHEWEGTSETPRRLSEDSSLLFGIRDYIAGDRLAQIHWRTSARTGQFKVKQFEPLTQPRIRIILDAMAAFDSPEQWELAIEIAASLLDLAARQSQAVGLLWVGDGDGRLGVGTGQQHYTQLRDYLAGLPPSWPHGAESSMSYIPKDAIPIWITAAGTHPARAKEDPVLYIGGELASLEDLPFYLEHGLYESTPGGPDYLGQ